LKVETAPWLRFEFKWPQAAYVILVPNDYFIFKDGPFYETTAAYTCLLWHIYVHALKWWRMFQTSVILIVIFTSCQTDFSRQKSFRRGENNELRWSTIWLKGIKHSRANVSTCMDSDFGEVYRLLCHFLDENIKPLAHEKKTRWGT
jgi:hypothetical protein